MWVEISSDRLDLISLFRELGYEARESYLTMLFEPNPEQVERNVPVERFTVADATSLSLLEFTERRSWLRQKDNIEAQALLGRALISSERVESCVFYCEKGGYVSVSCAEAPGGDLALEALLTALAKEYGKPLLFPRVNKSESAYQTLVRMGASIVEWYLGYYCRASRDS